MYLPCAVCAYNFLWTWRIFLFFSCFPFTFSDNKQNISFLLDISILSFSIHVSKFYMPLCFPTFIKARLTREDAVRLGDILEYLVGARIPWLATTMGSGCGSGTHESSSPESSPVAAAARRHKSNVRMQQSRVPALPLLRCCRKD